MGKYKDITNQKFGKLTAKNYVGTDKHRNAVWQCVCDCGKEKTTTYASLKSGHCTSCGCKKRADLSGKIFGKLKVISKSNKRDHGKIYWNCQCDCGNTTILSTSDIVLSKILSCGCLLKRKGKNNPKFLGHESITGKFISDIRTSAKKRKIDFDNNINAEYLWDLYLRQNKKCALSGIDIDFYNNKNASVDRIDSLKGYTKENIQLVDKIVNNIKMDLDQDVFIRICGMVYERNKYK